MQAAKSLYKKFWPNLVFTFFFNFAIFLAGGMYVRCENYEFFIKNEKFFIKKHKDVELFIKITQNEVFCIKNDESCSSIATVSKTDEICIKNDELLFKMMNFVLKTSISVPKLMYCVSKTRNCVLKTRMFVTIMMNSAVYRR